MAESDECFGWENVPWMRDAPHLRPAGTLLVELKEFARIQHDTLREVHPDVGEMKAQVVEEQGEKINEMAA